MSGDGLCSPAGPCLDPDTGDHTDTSEVDGLQGGAADTFEPVEPDTAFKPYPAPGPAYPAAGPDASYMVDADGGLTRNDASRIGDVEVYQPGPIQFNEQFFAQGGGVSGGPGGGGGGGALPPDFEPPYDPGWEPAPPPPDDGWWDPPPIFIDTDLAVDKAGPVTCQAGVDCHYTLTITNVGAVPYVGPLALIDTMPDGATLSTASPGWHCTVAAPDVSCITIGFAALPVGAVATLHLDIQLPNPFVGPVAHNCVGIDWFEMGTDDGPGDGNDFACIDTPVIAGFDLGIEKVAPVDCVDGAECIFGIKVTNYGPGTFSGTVAVHDTLPPGLTFVAGGDCVGLAGAIDCQRAGVTMGIAGVEVFLFKAKLPTGLAGSSIENCVDIDWSHMAADDGSPDAHPDHACVTVHVQPLAGYFDLWVTKAGPAQCDTGGDCSYDIAVANNGPDDYVGGIALHDKMPAGASFVGITSSAPWICLAAPPDVNCAIVGVLVVHPGDTYGMTLKIKLPSPIPGGAVTVQNCADIPWSTGGLPADDHPAPVFEKADSACIDTNVDAGFDLKVEKHGPMECYEGGLCDYAIVVTNDGPRPFSGIISVKDTLPAGGSVETSSNVSSCASFAPGTMTCATAAFPLSPGWTQTFNLGVRLPDPVIGDTVTNCATLDWTNPFGEGPSYTGDDNAATDGPACVTTDVLAADLAPFGATVCDKGAPCTLNVSIDNLGGRTFKGAAGLRGTLNPAVPIGSVKSLTSGLACNVTGEGTYECLASQLTLAPGESASLQVVINIPADFTERRIVHRKEMVWPDVRSKDSNPADDRHVSTIVIRQPEQPAPPVCTGGEVVDGKCVCPEGTIRQSKGDNAFACVRPPLVCVDGIVRGGQCFCPEGAERQQTGNNAYRCIAAPPPQTICEGGRVRGGECQCPDGTDRQQVGDNAYRCITRPPEIICKGGRVRGGECQCPNGTDRLQTGDNAYRCVTPPPQIICEGGRVRGGECRCPDGTERRQTGDNAYRCITPAPKIICKGGRVRGGECQCPKGTEQQQTGDNAYRCVTPPPQIKCEGGRVRGGECRCPRGTERQQIGDNAYRCVTSQPEIICKGGRVRGGECQCPRGTERQQIGDNAYRCVTSQPEIICKGGRVRGGECRCPQGTNQQQIGANAFQCVRTPSLQNIPREQLDIPRQQLVPRRLLVPRKSNP